MNKQNKYADVPIRLMIGVHLVYGTQDNIFSWERMLEFRNFLEAFGAPFPMISAIVSVYAQFICGLLFIAGWKVRYAGYIMTFNFIVAILLVHTGDSYPNTFPAISMLLGSIFMILNGAGIFSVDSWVKIRKAAN